MIGSLEWIPTSDRATSVRFGCLRLGREPMPDDEPRAPLDGVDPLHVAPAATGQGSAASAWIAEAASVVATSKTTSPCT